MKHVIKEKVKPWKAILEGEHYKITEFNSCYLIEEFIIETDENNKIKKLILPKANHPNCNPENQEFCGPEYFKQVSFPFDKYSLYCIKLEVGTFSLDQCYQIPRLIDLKLEKMENLIHIKIKRNL